MPHSYTNLVYHIVFATQGRLPLIKADLESRLYDYLGGIVRGLGGVLIEIGGCADHIHLLVRLNQNLALAEFMKKLKANSSGWAARTNGKKFKWQGGYGAFTVSESQIDRVRKYIRNQKGHHRRGLSFDDEFVTLLKAHRMEFNVEYLWR